MPFGLALLSVERSGEPLVALPVFDYSLAADGGSLGKIRAALKQFVLRAEWDAAHCADEELIVLNAVVHYKLLPGNEVMAVVLGRRGENPYVGKEALSELEMVSPCTRHHDTCSEQSGHSAHANTLAAGLVAGNVRSGSGGRRD
jgi:hypothetical protein